MTKLLRLPVGGLVVVTICVCLPKHALSWQPQETCGGYNVTWPSPFYLQQNTCSIPSGSTRYAAVTDQINRWRNVGGMRAMVGWSAFSNPSCVIDSNDEINEIAFIPKAQIDGSGGRTILTTDWCVLPGDEDYDSAKIFIASTRVGTRSSRSPRFHRA